LHQGKSILPLKQAPMLFPCRQSESDAPTISGENLKATPLWEAISHVVVCRAQPARNDRRHDQEKLLEGHPQDTKSALAENESVKIE
jgi:hypothetical protein